MNEHIYIGAPVHLIFKGVVSRNWVGYIRRINWNKKLVEVGPEACIGSHLHGYEFAQICPALFTRLMHPQLPAEIERLQRSEWSVIGKPPKRRKPQ